MDKEKVINQMEVILEMMGVLVAELNESDVRHYRERAQEFLVMAQNMAGKFAHTAWQLGCGDVREKYARLLYSMENE